MGCVQCKDKEAAKLTEERDGSLNQSSGYRYGTDPTPQHYPSFGVTSIPNYNNFHAAGGQGLTVFGGVNSSSHTGTLRTRGGTGKPLSVRRLRAQLCSFRVIAVCGWEGCRRATGVWQSEDNWELAPSSHVVPGIELGSSSVGSKCLYPLSI